MKKIKIFIICICIIITSKAFASDLFLTPSFWQTATQKEIFASIDNGENINIETENGLTAVALALSESNNPNIFDILIEKGVKINTNDDATVIKLNFAAKKIKIH